VVKRSVRSRRSGFALIDAVVGGVLLSVALVVILGIAGRCLEAQRTGTRMQEVAMLADGLLAEVAALGPDVYSKQFPAQGTFEPPFQAYRYDLEIEDQGVGVPYKVRAHIVWDGADGQEQEEVIETLLAAKQLPGADIEDAKSREPEKAVER